MMDKRGAEFAGQTIGRYHTHMAGVDELLSLPKKGHLSVTHFP